MPTCFSMLPTRFEDGRHEAIEQGFRESGYTVSHERPVTPGSQDVLVSWNTYGNAARHAHLFRRHVVAEEAYIRVIGGQKYFALGLNGHNGQNQNPIGDEARWVRWGIPVADWRTDGDHLLVCGQRGFGYNEMAMPDNWQDTILSELRSATTMPIHFRPHPKRRRRMPTRFYDKIEDFERPMLDQLDGVWAVVVYTSNAATDALLAGVPAFYCGPNLITAGASERGVANIHSPSYGDRLPAFVRLSWSQFSFGEIKSGWAISQVLGRE